jgi:hypothetical protein
LEAINVIVPEYLVIALLMDKNVDCQEIVIAENDVIAKEFLVVPGYLCNGPNFIGKTISNSDIAEYILDCTVERPVNSWTNGFQQYINRTQRFCLVQPLHEYYDQASDEGKAKVQHLLCFPPGTYFCNCFLYWSRLHCPASIFINDLNKKLHPSLHQRISRPYSGRETAFTTPGRRRGARPTTQRNASYLWESLGLSADTQEPTLEFLASCSKHVLDKAAKLRHWRPSPKNRFQTKSDAIIHLLAGTVLGNWVHVEGTLDRRQLIGTWEELQSRFFTDGRLLLRFTQDPSSGIFTPR